MVLACDGTFFFQVKAILLYFGFHPFKKLIDVEPKRSLSRDEVAHLYSISVPVDGHFKHLRKIGGVNVYIFNFDKTKGCRDISPEFHGALPPCTERNVPMTTMISNHSKNVSVGGSFFYVGVEPTVEYDDDSYTLRFSYSAGKEKVES